MSWQLEGASRPENRGFIIVTIRAAFLIDAVHRVRTNGFEIVFDIRH